MKLLSVSVAAYNMEKLIRQNLDSFVTSRAAGDVEVLVVNDGSTDGTARIAAEYAKKYPDTVRLIDQPNAGPGSTVNRGLSEATGKYFRMVDADDWVEPDFADFVDALRDADADMIVTDYVMVDDKTGERRPCRVEGLEPGRVCAFSDVCAALDLQMHAVTYRTQLLRDNNVRVFDGFYTDLQYLLFPTPFVGTALYVPRTVYAYRVSLTGQSMSAPSMQRNIGMHTDVLFSLTALYQSLKPVDANRAAYVMRRVVMMAGAQLGTLLSFKPSARRKKDLFAFFDRLKAECPDAYAQFSALKTVRVVRLAGGLPYRAVSALHRRRIGLKG